MLIFIATEHLGPTDKEISLNEDVIKAESLEAARKRLFDEYCCYDESQIKEIRPATLDDVERLLTDDFECETLHFETIIRAATSDEVKAYNAWTDELFKGDL